MKAEYDFSKGKRGALDPLPPGKTRITIRLPMYWTGFAVK